MKNYEEMCQPDMFCRSLGTLTQSTKALQVAVEGLHKGLGQSAKACAGFGKLAW